MAYEAVKKNMMQMLREGANQTELDLYVASMGLTPDDLKEDKHTLERAGYQALGGMAGGAVASPGVVSTPVGIGLGSAFGGQVYDLKEELLGKKVKETLPEKMISGAEDFVLDVISPIALSKGIYGIKKVGGAVVGKARGIFRPAEYDVYKKFGIKPTAALATQSKGIAAAEHALGDFPLSADILQKRAQENITSLDFASKFLAREYGEVLSREELGILLKKASPNVLSRYDEIYDKLFTFVGRDIGSNPQPIENTVQMLRKLVRESQTGPSSGVLNLAKEMASKARPIPSLQRSMTNEPLVEGLPWESIKKYRTKIGEMMRRPELVTTRNIQSGDLKRLYGAMTADMEKMAIGAGEKTHARWRAANKYFELKLNRDVPILEEIIKKKYPEEVYDIVMKSSPKGPSRLKLLKKQLSDNEWSAVVGTVLGELGTQTPGAATTAQRIFSPQTFMTNWSKISTQAKNILFRGKEYGGLVKELDDFVKVAGDMKQIEQLANKSRTGSVLMFYGLFQSAAGMGGAIVGGASGFATVTALGVTTVGLPRITAKLLTNEKFVRWINKGFQIAKSDPAAMSTHLSRLMVLRFRPDVQEDVDNLIRSILE